MVRVSKSNSSSVSVPPVSVSVSVPPVVASEKKSRKQTKSTTTAVEPAPVVAQVTPAVPDNEVVAPVIEEDALTTKLSEFSVKLHQTISLLTALKADYKVLSKSVEKTQKQALKKSSHKRKLAINRAPSGFVKPAKITKELASFLGISNETLIARTEVSKLINQYIRAHNLQDKDNGRKILPDEKLTVLLNLKPADPPLTYFNLQRFMKHHFIKESTDSA
jgi:chromatin remodeling complex protein RSC6